jgi:hypothetical protein
MISLIRRFALLLVSTLLFFGLPFSQAAEPLKPDATQVARELMNRYLAMKNSSGRNRLTESPMVTTLAVNSCPTG